MRTGRNGDGRAGLPVARGDADRPTIAGRAWAGTDLDVATSEAEHAHAGGVLSPRDIVTPTGPAEGENDRWIFNPGAIVDNSEKRSLIGFDDFEVDSARTCPARVLDELGENVTERIIEKARDLGDGGGINPAVDDGGKGESEEHTSELQSLMRISYAVFCLKKKNNTEQETS